MLIIKQIPIPLNSATINKVRTVPLQKDTPSNTRQEIYSFVKNSSLGLIVLFVFLTLPTLLSCQLAGANSTGDKVSASEAKPEPKPEAKPGAYNTEAYLGLLRGKRIAVVANQTSVIRNRSGREYTHLVDSLLSLGVEIDRVFAPEHGFRGQLDAGEQVEDQVDPKTGLPILSLYGKNKKPSREQLSQIDLVLFDIQDVGVRFYTYISTLHYIMEACAESGVPLMVLDRPNPNGHYVDGPVLDPKFKSFVGMHPVPVVYGMTMGEYARMINGEKWLEQGVRCELEVIPNRDYDHQTPYILPVKPSPNLPNEKAVNLYPSLCLFEGTRISCGRGTEMQFQVFGAPELPANTFDFQFTPRPNFGSKFPKHEGQICNGRDLRKKESLDRIHLEWIIEAYENYPEKSEFFNDFFVKLAGTERLRENIEKGTPEEQIREEWRNDLRTFATIRSKYLLYE